MIRGFDDQEPTVAESAYVDPAATVIGNVTIEVDATILPGAVIRGDGGGEVVLILVAVILLLTSLCYLRRQTRSAWILNSSFHVLTATSIREAANVQDNVTIHADAPGERVLLEEHAAVGHNAIVHNATVGAHSLVGMGATVLDGATLDPYSVVAANSLVTEGTTVASETLVAGTPAEPIREGLDCDGDFFETAAHYTERVEGLTRSK